MAFKSNINYAAYEGLRQRGGEGLTRAKWLKKKEEEEEARRAAAEAKAAATKRSGQRSGLKKLGSAALRAAAAYYTSGASEAFGGGDIIDEVVLGRDDQGRPVRNEYGELVRAGSGIYGAMKAKKAGDVARKRGSNIQDYEEQVRLATEMGKLDKVLGKEMLQDAQSYRARQQAQTQAGEDASVWGWDNEFDELALSPAQIAGKEEANRRSLRGWGGDRGGGDRFKEQQEEDSLRSRIRSIPTVDLGPTGEELEKGGRERRLESPGYQNFLKEKEEDREWDRLSKEMDRPLTGADIAKGSMRRPDYELDEAWDKLSKEDDLEQYMKEKSAEKRLDYDPALEKTTTEFKGSPITPYKTYSEKEAEKLSRMDDHRPTALDELAIEGKVKGLKKQSFLERLFDRSDEDKQLLLEDELNKKRALAREHKRTGGPFGSGMRKGSYYDPYESPLLKRMRAKRKAKALGSILHS